ncbi:NucA/NucB deoxyribonuclease domain-containing protein [Streptomyces lasiicapitis]|uniref:NucA/NucB deoxyribonuclease domain-containing protein n=1 Tax=Streptomyces lasiicapitis TaxID=1923961 RepID=UPI003649BAD2
MRLPSSRPYPDEDEGTSSIAANIAKIQDSGPHHYGLKGKGSTLTRSTSDKNEKDNRNKACPKSRKRPPGKSCDEYPFARTNQGAARVARKDWGWAWVPEREQHQQGGFLSRFYKENRVLDGDRFWVDVRN